MPPLPQRVNNIATSVNLANAIAPCPAPDGNSNAGTPARSVAAANCCINHGAHGAAGADTALFSVTSILRPWQIASIACTISLTAASRVASSAARISSDNWQAPGITLTEPFGTCNWPTVPTSDGAW